jgi:hypothetical protein
MLLTAARAAARSLRPQVADSKEDGMNADLQPRAGRPGTSLPRGAGRGPASAQPPAGGGVARHVAERYRRAVEPAVRGVAGAAAAVVFFAAGAAVDGRAGLAIASVWVLVAGTYCLANLWHCRERHCAVTGPGWTLAALLGFAAVATPGTTLPWYRVSAEAVVFVLILAAGYGLEHLVAARTGSRALPGRDGGHAQDR